MGVEETNAFKQNNFNKNADEKMIFAQRSSAVRLAKEHLIKNANGQRRGSVVINLNRKQNEISRQASAELQIIEDIPNDFNPFGGAESATTSEAENDNSDLDTMQDVDIENADNFAPLGPFKLIFFTCYFFELYIFHHQLPALHVQTGCVDVFFIFH